MIFRDVRKLLTNSETEQKRTHHGPRAGPTDINNINPHPHHHRGRILTTLTFTLPPTVGLSGINNINPHTPGRLSAQTGITHTEKGRLSAQTGITTLMSERLPRASLLFFIVRKAPESLSSCYYCPKGSREPLNLEINVRKALESLLTLGV